MHALRRRLASAAAADTCDALLDAGTDITLQTYAEGYTAIELAAQGNDTVLANKLMRRLLGAEDVLAKEAVGVEERATARRLVAFKHSSQLHTLVDNLIAVNADYAAYVLRDLVALQPVACAGKYLVPKGEVVVGCADEELDDISELFAHARRSSLLAWLLAWGLARSEPAVEVQAYRVPLVDACSEAALRLYVRLYARTGRADVLGSDCVQAAIDMAWTR